MLGLYLDQLNEVERDRVIAGQGWTTYWLATTGGDRCLLGHAWDFDAEANRPRDLEAHRAWMKWANERRDRGAGIHVGERFDALASRVGLDRAVQLVKARAAKRNRVTLPARKSAPATVGSGA